MIKKVFLVGIVALISVMMCAQSEAQKEVQVAFGIDEEQSSKPAEIFHNKEPKHGVSSDFGFQANIDIYGLFSRAPGWIITDFSTGHQWISDPCQIGGVSMGGGLGFRYREYVYFGAAFSFFGDWGKTAVYDNTTTSLFTHGTCKANTWVAPIYADLRIYVPTDSRCYPFFDLGIGGYVGMTGTYSVDCSMYPSGPVYNGDIAPNSGFYFQFGLGAELKYFTVGVGYNLYSNSFFNDHYGYIKVGVSLGRPALLKEMY